MKIYDGDGEDVPPDGAVGSGERRPVGVAEFAVVEDLTTLVTSGLGSCVAIGLTDGENAAGLLHVMLPSAEGRDVATPAKFADTGVPALVEALCCIGADRESLVGKIAGGSEMIRFRSQTVSIGTRNVEAVRRALEAEDVPLIGSDVGGDQGRSVEFSMSGELLVKTARAGERSV